MLVKQLPVYRCGNLLIEVTWQVVTQQLNQRWSNATISNLSWLFHVTLMSESIYKIFYYENRRQIRIAIAVNVDANTDATLAFNIFNLVIRLKKRKLWWNLYGLKKLKFQVTAVNIFLIFKFEQCFICCHFFAISNKLA